MPKSIAIVLPTKNRPDELLKAVESILLQTFLPSELIIVDQSSVSDSMLKISSLCERYKFSGLHYLYDTEIVGLVDAKREGLKSAKSDIICFLEDDIVLDTKYLECIVRGFVEYKGMGGCCGVVINEKSMPPFYCFLFAIFHRGYFSDPRVRVYAESINNVEAMIPSDKLSGGSSAWRREIFNQVSFDVANGFHMLEDIDFSLRASTAYSSIYEFYINTNALLFHYPSPLNRYFLGERQHRKMLEYVVFFKKHRRQRGVLLSFSWLFIGLLMEALFQSFASRSPVVIKGFVTGTITGCKRKVVM